MRALDAEEKRVLRIMAAIRVTGRDHHGDANDAQVIFRLYERGCVKVRPADELRGEAQLTELGAIAARLP